jgi:hypothetical protein
VGDSSNAPMTAQFEEVRKCIKWPNGLWSKKFLNL